jgi:hypothetical protein
MAECEKDSQIKRLEKVSDWLGDKIFDKSDGFYYNLDAKVLEETSKGNVKIMIVKHIATRIKRKTVRN